MSSVAVAIPRGPAPVGLAMNVAVPESRMTRSDVRRIGETLMAAVGESVKLLHGAAESVPSAPRE